MSVRLHVLSDLHLEHGPFAPEAAQADVIVLAGDIAIGTRGVKWAREWARGRPVLYLAGNHEFYGQEMPTLTDELRREAAGSSVQVLENDEVTIDRVRFLGCTLWSDFDFDGADRRGVTMEVCERVVNDYQHISFGPGGRLLTPSDTRGLHLSSRRWLESRLSEPHPGPTVVLTHHAPVIRARPAEPILRAVAGAFASDLTALMGGDRVGLWIFGHTHRVADFAVRGTRIVSNQRGYPRDPVAGFDPTYVIEIDGTTS